MAPAPVIPVAPLPPVSGDVMVPLDPVIPEGPVPVASPQVTPPDTSDDSSHEEAGPPHLEQNTDTFPLVQLQMNLFFVRRTKSYVPKNARTNWILGLSDFRHNQLLAVLVQLPPA